MTLVEVLVWVLLAPWLLTGVATIIGLLVLPVALVIEVVRARRRRR